MGAKTNIEWTTHSFSPWIGCTKVSPGCKNCYAETLDNRYYGGTHWGKGALRKRTSAGTWKNPLKWDAQVAAHPDYRARVFPSLCDWLDDEVPIEWLADFLKLIHDTPNLDWLLLSKRPENWCERLDTIIDAELCADELCADWHNGKFPHNIWIGVSVEDQKRADERIPQLLQIPAKVRFLSVEPLLEKVNLTGNQERQSWPRAEACAEGHGIDWVIVGGESGPGRRDCDVDAITDIANQCFHANVPCFVKQDSAFKPGQKGRIPDVIWALKQFPTHPGRNRNEG